jgi:protein-tyrosine phosphatase
MDESVAMIHMAAADGTTDIVATPHASPTYAYDRRVVEELAGQLRAQAPPSIRIHCGCDFHLSLENIRDAISNPSKYVIEETTYLLVEFPEFINISMMDRALHDIVAAGLIPIITHPERNRVLQKEAGVLKKWADRDCLVQITAQSILGAFGRTAKRSAEAMLQRGVVNCVASDAHDTKHRPPILSEAYERVKKRHGKEMADLLFADNPSRVLEGVPVPRTTEPVRRFLGFRY